MAPSLYRLLQRTFDQHLARHKVLTTPDERDDALHSAIVRFLESGPDTPLESKRALAWLTTTARRTLLDRRRRDRYLSGGTAEHPEEELLSTDSADHDAMRWTVETLLDKLSEPHRVVMALRMEGLSRGEIASQLNLPKETVNKRLTRAATALRATLKVDDGIREEVQRYDQKNRRSPATGAEGENHTKP